MFVKPEQSQIQLVVRVFTDDFTASLSRFTSTVIKLDPDQLSETVISGHMSNYFQRHFQLKSPKDSAVFSFVGWEYKHDQTILYASFDSLSEMIQLEWSNTFLMDVFPDQKNIVTLTTPKTKKSYLHTKNLIFAKYSF
tara:strand:+ start:2014 stop:2427 length:414 start_codon:yes stop_codon:yes gene_type:complete